MKPTTSRPGTVGELRLRLHEVAEAAGDNELVLAPVIEATNSLDPWGDDDPATMVPEQVMRDVRSKFAHKQEPVHKQTAEEFAAKMDEIHGR